MRRGLKVLQARWTVGSQAGSRPLKQLFLTITMTMEPRYSRRAPQERPHSCKSPHSD